MTASYFATNLYRKEASLAVSEYVLDQLYQLFSVEKKHPPHRLDIQVDLKPAILAAVCCGRQIISPTSAAEFFIVICGATKYNFVAF